MRVIKNLYKDGQAEIDNLKWVERAVVEPHSYDYGSPDSWEIVLHFISGKTTIYSTGTYSEMMVDLDKLYELMRN